MNIDLLGINYEIKDEEIVDEDINCLGMIDYKKQDIYIKKSLKTDLRNVTIIHEILHGILQHTGNDELNQDEDLINRLSTSIYQVFKNNKDLIIDLFEDVQICNRKGRKYGK